MLKITIKKTAARRFFFAAGVVCQWVSDSLSNMYLDNW